MNVKLELHDGKQYEETIESFNLLNFIEEINTDQHKMIQFGRYGFIKGSIKVVDSTDGAPIVVN